MMFIKSHHIKHAKCVATEGAHGMANAYVFEHFLPEKLALGGTVFYEFAGVLAIVAVVFHFVREFARNAT